MTAEVRTLDPGLELGHPIARAPAWLTLPVGVGATIIMIWVAVAITVSCPLRGRKLRARRM